jgi:hypothetical protein
VLAQPRRDAVQQFGALGGRRALPGGLGLAGGGDRGVDCSADAVASVTRTAPVAASSTSGGAPPPATTSSATSSRGIHSRSAALRRRV